MAVYKLSDSGLVPLEVTSFEREGIRERLDLQRHLRSSIEILAPGTMLIAEEFGYWDEGRRRIDLLALDKQANLVVIELKRDETGAHMELQAIRYAAMVSTMTFDQAVSAHAAYLRSSGDDPLQAAQRILTFLKWDVPREDEFALDVRIILVSAEFSKELTTAVLWLNGRDIDIRCVRMRPCKTDGSLFLDVQQVIPLPEAEEYQIRIREQATERRSGGRDTRDLTKYVFQGELYNKRRLVLGMVKAYVRDHPASTVEQLETEFPAHLQGSHRVFRTIEAARAIFEQTGHKRHFLEDDEIVRLADGNQIAVASMWGLDNLARFLSRARELGYEATAEAADTI